MVTIPSSSAWSKSLAQPAAEFASTSLSVISGKIPEELNGTLYRNSPGRLSRGGEQVGHWFDGDGAILAVNFADSTATAVYRYVQTKGYQQEAAADAWLYPNYGMTAPGGWWQNLLKPVKNSANTSVLALDERLLALWEGGLPYALDLETLETLGQDNLGGLTDKQSFSAHPKVDPVTGDIYNFGVSIGLNTTLNLYCCDRTGKLKQQNSIPLKGLGLPLIHDFVLAGEYLIFLVPPVRVNKLAVLFGQKCYSDAMAWKPELGTEILICDRQNLSLISRSQTAPWYQWHFANGYVDNEGNIILDIVRYPDFSTNQFLQEVVTGEIKTPAKATLWELKLAPQTAKVIENKQLIDHNCEFPVVSPAVVGKPWRYTYLSVQPYGVNTQTELFKAIAVFDRQTKNLAIADLGVNCYPSEAILVPQADNPEQGWLLTVVYDATNDCSEVRIYQSHRLFDEPVCRLGLPSVVPPSFHGTWQARR